MSNEQKQYTPSEHLERYLNTSPRNVFDRPKQIIETQSPAMPMSNTGFRPMWSEMRLQCSTNMASAAKNSDSYIKLSMRVYGSKRCGRENLQ